LRNLSTLFSIVEDTTDDDIVRMVIQQLGVEMAALHLQVIQSILIPTIRIHPVNTVGIELGVAREHIEIKTQIVIVHLVDS